MSSRSHRSRVSYTQLEVLWEHLDQNRSLATGYNKTSQAREFLKRMWCDIADILNAHSDGASKNWKGWCKYWNDYKSKLKKRVTAARSSRQHTGGEPSKEQPLTYIELKFLEIMGEDLTYVATSQHEIPSRRVPQAEPRRQRQRRAEPPVTQQASRRASMTDAEERNNISRLKLEAMNNLVEEIKSLKNELREMKNILHTRLPLPSTYAE